jgi:hypothetical protein
MARRENLSLAEAVDYLETVASLEESLERKPRLLRDPAQAQARARECLERVTAHLRRYCAIHDLELGSRTHLEGIRSLVELAGKAARKLDRVTALFQLAQTSRLAQQKEIAELEDFVRTVVGPESVRQEEQRAAWEEEHADEWAPGMVEEAYQIRTAEQLRGDAEYELLQIRDEEGNRYFGPELLRSIRNACRLADYLAFEAGEDPLVQVHLWFDRNMQVAAQSIYLACETLLRAYFKQAGRARGQPLVAKLNQAVMALMLARSPFNLLRNCAAKSCTEYFYDFHALLRGAMESETYQEMVSGEPDGWRQLQIDLAHQLCRSLYDHQEGTRELVVHLRRILGGASRVEGLIQDQERLAELLKRVPNGPLFKALDLLQEADLRHAPFDPIRQRAVPCRTATLAWDQQQTGLLRLPAPVVQEWIHKAVIAPEFIGFLRANAAIGQRHLMINLQSRTSWQEVSRAQSLESLQRAGELADAFTVVTVPRDNDFYHQTGAFHDLQRADHFFQAFLEQVGSTETGYFISVQLGQTLTPSWWSDLLATVRNCWYGERETLTRHQRLDCIELVQQLLVLKLIETLRPATVSFTCKDGVDLSSPAQVELVALLHALQGASPDSGMIDWMRLQLFGYPLLVREREVNGERFKRCLSLCHALDPDKCHALSALFPKVQVILPEEPAFTSHQ